MSYGDISVFAGTQEDSGSRRRRRRLPYKRDQQSRNVAAVIFKIGIVNDANFAGGVLQGSADGSTFAGISLVSAQEDAIVFLRDAL